MGELFLNISGLKELDTSVRRHCEGIKFLLLQNGENIQYKCSICSEIFQDLKEVMPHRKTHSKSRYMLVARPNKTQDMSTCPELLPTQVKPEQHFSSEQNQSNPKILNFVIGLKKKFSPKPEAPKRREYVYKIRTTPVSGLNTRTPPVVLNSASSPLVLNLTVPPLTTSSLVPKSTEGKNKECYTCNSCSQFFTSHQDLLDNHRDFHCAKIHEKVYSHFCEVCFQMFESKEFLEKHMQEHEACHACSSCSHFFESKALLDNHRQFDCGVVKCSHCPELLFSDQAELVQHTHHTHNEAESQLSDSDNVDADTMRSKPQLYKCRFCAIEYRTKGELDSHYAAEHPWRCKRCKMDWQTKAQYEDHLKIHENESYPCKMCAKRYKTKWFLKLHMRQHDNFLCEICSKGLKTREGLAYHLKVHRGEQERCVCDVCGVSVIKKQMKQHKEFHEGKRRNRVRPREKKHKCVICGAVFLGRQKLERHVMTHTGKRPFKCEICHKESIQKCNLQRHKCRPPV